MHARFSNALSTFYVVAPLLGLFLRIYSTSILYHAISHFESLQHPIFKYIGSDIPRELPGEYPEVALVFQKNDTTYYPLDDNDAWNTLWPDQLGLIRLGPKGRPLGISMYHQLHCLSSIRYAYMAARLGLTQNLSSDTTVAHNTHCFHFIRQSILCNADMTVIPLLAPGQNYTDAASNGESHEEIHRCRDWTKVREFVERNQKEWKDVPLARAWEDAL